jgi:protein-S-isoprenylcysteine O-methyltransferase Ste14
VYNGAVRRIFGREPSDLVLFGVTWVELAFLPVLTPTFAMVDWIYVAQHLLVQGIALVRRAPAARDRSAATTAAVAVAYAYPYAQVAYLRLVPGEPVWPAGSLAIVTAAACWSFVSLLSLGRSFGVRPALRDLAAHGPYRLVRHPLYLAYVVSDIGYNLDEANVGTALLVMAGWGALLYRIRAEERVMSGHPGWPRYTAVVRYRLLPGIW